MYLGGQYNFLSDSGLRVVTSQTQDKNICQMPASQGEMPGKNTGQVYQLWACISGEDTVPWLGSSISEVWCTAIFFIIQKNNGLRQATQLELSGRGIVGSSSFWKSHFNKGLRTLFFHCG